MAMSLIEWDRKRFSVLVDDMDEQHKVWIGLINRLHDSLVGEGEDVWPEELLKEMCDYTQLHFSKEEQLMREVDYPEYEAHKDTHTQFIAELKEMKQKLKEGDFVLRTQVMSMLKGWLENHITTIDKRYGDFISKS
jgi:hemerythrin